MSNKDGTGPDGEGSRTGLQRGNCKGATPQERGRGCGRGVRRQRRFQCVTGTKEEQKETLLKEKEYIEKRLKELA